MKTINELREALCDTLELAGFEYLEAEDAETALDILTRQQVAMVVTDVNMPGMDGHQLLDKIHETYPALPVMLITAFGQVSKAVEAIKAGAVDYLMKPFDSERLNLVCAQICGRGSSSK